MVYLAESIWVLPIILHDVDIIRGGQEASECGGMGIPEGSGYNALKPILVGAREKDRERLTILKENVQALLDEEVGVEND